MDKIWYRNPSKSEVIGCCGGDDYAEPTNIERLKKVKLSKEALGTILLSLIQLLFNLFETM